MYERVWDEADYVVPPAENGAFFVTTNVVITPNQTRGYCPEVNELIILSDKHSQLCNCISITSLRFKNQIVNFNFYYKRNFAKFIKHNIFVYFFFCHLQI